MRAEKKFLIAEVESHLKKSDYVILTNYNGATVSDLADLRGKLSAEKAEFHVVKNSSLRVAAKALGLPEIEGALTGPTAVIVGGRNSPGVAKILKQFFKDKQKIEVKAGRVEFKMDKTGNIGVGVGKRSFTTGQILENAQVVLDAIGKAKPALFKGNFIKTLVLSSSQSPAVRIAPSEYSKY